MCANFTDVVDNKSSVTSMKDVFYTFWLRDKLISSSVLELYTYEIEFYMLISFLYFYRVFLIVVWKVPINVALLLPNASRAHVTIWTSTAKSIVQISAKCTSDCPSVKERSTVLKAIICHAPYFHIYVL